MLAAGRIAQISAGREDRRQCEPLPPAQSRAAASRLGGRASAVLGKVPGRGVTGPEGCVAVAACLLVVLVLMVSE